MTNSTFNNAISSSPPYCIFFYPTIFERFRQTPNRKRGREENQRFLYSSLDGSNAKNSSRSVFYCVPHLPPQPIIGTGAILPSAMTSIQKLRLTNDFHWFNSRYPPGFPQITHHFPHRFLWQRNPISWRRFQRNLFRQQSVARANKHFQQIGGKRTDFPLSAVNQTSPAVIEILEKYSTPQASDGSVNFPHPIRRALSDTNLLSMDISKDVRIDVLKPYSQQNDNSIDNNCQHKGGKRVSFGSLPETPATNCCCYCGAVNNNNHTNYNKDSNNGPRRRNVKNVPPIEGGVAKRSKSFFPSLSSTWLFSSSSSSSYFSAATTATTFRDRWRVKLASLISPTTKQYCRNCTRHKNPLFSTPTNQQQCSSSLLIAGRGGGGSAVLLVDYRHAKKQQQHNHQHNQHYYHPQHNRNSNLISQPPPSSSSSITNRESINASISGFPVNDQIKDNGDINSSNNGSFGHHQHRLQNIPNPIRRIVASLSSSIDYPHRIYRALAPNKINNNNAENSNNTTTNNKSALAVRLRCRTNTMPHILSSGLPNSIDYAAFRAWCRGNRLSSDLHRSNSNDSSGSSTSNDGDLSSVVNNHQNVLFSTDRLSRNRKFSSKESEKNEEKAEFDDNDDEESADSSDPSDDDDNDEEVELDEELDFDAYGTIRDGRMKGGQVLRRPIAAKILKGLVSCLKPRRKSVMEQTVAHPF